MANTEGRAQLAKGIDQLTEENLLYVLGVSQALAFAQGTINAPHAEPLDAADFLPRRPAIGTLKPAIMERQA
jgi:hypothetical protein